jgi:Asp-tRNA(Asn)/Glu-tRNA(Gln) amidotransferase A subunit family amidase
MPDNHSPLEALRAALDRGATTPVQVARDCLAHANTSASHNTYLHLDPDRVLREAAATEPGGRLYGVPVSLKDCFDLAGTRTTCGSSFYARHNPIAVSDSAMAQRLRALGCIIPGKTHLHPLAYGITGQNPDFGDSLQPRDATLLTGGSSSGAAASVLEGSALAAIGTDTGGSIRVPAALCGLVGYRASQSLAAPDGRWPDLWRGAHHLAPSFDTAGILLRDLRDLEPLARAIFGLPKAAASGYPSIGCVPQSFLHDANPDVLQGYESWKQSLAAAGARLSEFDATPWSDSVEIFAGIQAHEASAIHRGNFEHDQANFEASITQRLRWGASLSLEEVAALSHRHDAFRDQLARLLDQFDFLIMPCAPVNRLLAADDHSTTRARIIRYTTPFSLGGLPVVALPGEMLGAPFGTGVQLAAAPRADAALIAFAASLARGL